MLMIFTVALEQPIYANLTLCGHINTAEQRAIIQQYVNWPLMGGLLHLLARRGLGGLRPRPVPSSLYQM